MLRHMHGNRKPAAGLATRGVMIAWARFYDHVTALLLLGQEPALRTMTVDLAAVQPGERILEVGCGTGSLALAAARRAGPTGQVYGIDPDPTMIGIATRKAQKQRLDGTFQVGLIERLPFDEGEFDLVLSSLMLHHLPADLQVAGLAEVKRVLRPGGRFLAVDLAPPAGLSRLVLTPLLAKRMMQGGVGHLQPVLAQVGFTDVETGPTRMRLLAFLRGRA